MNKTVIALIVGSALGAAGTWLLIAPREVASEPQAEPAAPAQAALPELPEPYYEVLLENDGVEIPQRLAVARE